MNATPVQLPPKVEQSGSVRIITFTAGEFRDVENVIASELQNCLDASEGSHVLLDFTNVERISSVEMGTLVTLHKKMTASGGRLTMFNMKAEIYEVFTVARLQTFMGICREGEALVGARRTS
jgi:anti-anti-sigma factor